MGRFGLHNTPMSVGHIQKGTRLVISRAWLDVWPYLSSDGWHDQVSLGQAAYVSKSDEIEEHLYGVLGVESECGRAAS